MSKRPLASVRTTSAGRQRPRRPLEVLDRDELAAARDRAGPRTTRPRRRTDSPVSSSVGSAARLTPARTRSASERRGAGANPPPPWKETATRREVPAGSRSAKRPPRVGDDPPPFRRAADPRRARATTTVDRPPSDPAAARVGQPAADLDRGAVVDGQPRPRPRHARPARRPRPATRRARRRGGTRRPRGRPWPRQAGAGRRRAAAPWPLARPAVRPPPAPLPPAAASPRTSAALPETRSWAEPRSRPRRSRRRGRSRCRRRGRAGGALSVAVPPPSRSKLGRQVGPGLPRRRGGPRSSPRRARSTGRSPSPPPAPSPAPREGDRRRRVVDLDRASGAQPSSPAKSVAQPPTVWAPSASPVVSTSTDRDAVGGQGCIFVPRVSSSIAATAQAGASPRTAAPSIVAASPATPAPTSAAASSSATVPRCQPGATSAPPSCAPRRLVVFEVKVDRVQRIVEGVERVQSTSGRRIRHWRNASNAQAGPSIGRSSDASEPRRPSRGEEAIFAADVDPSPSQLPGWALPNQMRWAPAKRVPGGATQRARASADGAVGRDRAFERHPRRPDPGGAGQPPASSVNAGPRRRRGRIEFDADPQPHWATR